LVAAGILDLDMQFQKHDRVRVRTAGGTWIAGTVLLASSNGNALAVSLEHFLSPGSSFLHDAEGPTALLTCQEAGWVDVATGEVCEIAKGEVDG
jgi:hypothetical protein